MRRTDRDISYAKKVRWRWLTGACVVALAVLIWFTRDALLGSAMECRRQPKAHCVSYVGSSTAKIPLKGVTDAKPRRRKIVGTWMVDLVFADGSTRRTLPGGRVVEYRVGPFVAALRAAEVARKLQAFLRDPKQATMKIRQLASARRVAVLFVGVIFVFIAGIWAARNGWRRPRAPAPPSRAGASRA